MADRSRLHISKLDAFSEWLIKDGWKLEEPKGAYEVLRARKDGRKNPLIVYTKLEAKEHLSVMDRDCDVLGAFLKSAKESQKNQTWGDKIRAMTDEELAEFLDGFDAVCGMCIYIGECSQITEGKCREGFLQWLKSEAKEEN